jgi:hypothetical protein
MATIAEIRAQYPQYADMPDVALADALHKKFYSDIPRADFDVKIGLAPFTSLQNEVDTPIPKSASTLDVATSAPYKAIAGTADMLLNAPQNLINLGKMAYGTAGTELGGAKFLGSQFAPEITPPPNFATNALTRLGLIRETPNMTPGQRVLDVGLQSATGALLNPARSVSELGSTAVKNFLGGTAGQTVSETTGSPMLGLATAIATPSAITATAQQRQLALQAAQQSNAVRDATIRSAQQEGFVVTPGSITPSGQNVLLERLAGKTRLEQLASSRNQNTTDKLARQAVGVPENTPLTSEGMQAVRAQEFAKGYAPVSQLGPIQTDVTFQTALTNLSNKFTGQSASFPNATPDKVNQELKNYRVHNFDSGDALQASATLREQAKVNFRIGENALAKTQIGISRALEDQIERNLAATGNPNSADILAQFRASRQRMAISHSIEDAIREGSGSVDAKKLARDIQSGKYLSGELKTIAEFANIAPKVNQPVGSMGTPGAGAILGRTGTGAIAGGIGLATGGPITGLLAAAAPEATSALARQYLLSKFGQNRALPNYTGSNFLAQDVVTPGLRNALLGTTSVNNQNAMSK